MPGAGALLPTAMCVTRTHRNNDLDAASDTCADARQTMPIACRPLWCQVRRPSTGGVRGRAARSGRSVPGQPSRGPGPTGRARPRCLRRALQTRRLESLPISRALRRKAKCPNARATKHLSVCSSHSPRHTRLAAESPQLTPRTQALGCRARLRAGRPCSPAPHSPQH